MVRVDSRIRKVKSKVEELKKNVFRPFVDGTEGHKEKGFRLMGIIGTQTNKGGACIEKRQDTLRISDP